MKKNTFLAVLLFTVISLPVLAEQILTPYEYLDTTGARELSAFTLNNEHYIAVAQLAKDIPDTPPNMNGGDADVDVLIFKMYKGKHVVYQRIPGHGNESATFFTIGDSAFLAIASVNSGPHTPFNNQTYSMLYQWDGRYFHPIQQFYSYGTKQCYYFNIGKRHFLALANGVPLPENNNHKRDTNSMIYEWDGSKFISFQKIPSLWGYSFKSFQINDRYYLAFADHLNKSSLYLWDGNHFKVHQVFEGDGGRAFESFRINDHYYLAYANIKNDSVIYQWNGKHFIKYQILKGAGGRNFTYFNIDSHHYLFRVNFITGNRSNPKSNLQSPLYKWENNQFVTVQNIPTFGGVSAHVYQYDDLLYLALANSLSADLRFRVNSVIYKISQAPVIEYG